MSSDDFTVPDDLSELLGPAPQTAAPPAGRVFHQPASTAPAPTSAAAVDLGGVAGASSRARLEIGRMLFGRRLSDEQRLLREQAKAEETVGKVLDRLTRVGARVLHDRRAPVGHGQVDHLIITGAGIHLVETLPVSDRRRVTVDAVGNARVGLLPLWQRLRHMDDLADELADRTNALMERRRVCSCIPW